MKPFGYHQPGQIPDAAKLLTSIEDSKLVAGGMGVLLVLTVLIAPNGLVLGVMNLLGRIAARFTQRAG